MGRANHDDLGVQLCELPSWSGITAKPVTVSAIIDHVKRAATGLGKAERSFVADLAAAKDPAEFIQDSFFDAALEGGKMLREESYSLGDEDEDGGGWFGLHEFLGLYVVNVTQHGEGEERYGPFANLKEAADFFEVAVAMNSP